jgi:N-acetylneuraminic acid mutarotase
MCENMDLFVLDLESYRWNLLKPQAKNNDKANLPVTRDEHSCIVHDDSMVVFGGFSFGEKTNSIFKYHFRSNTWEQLHA